MNILSSENSLTYLSAILGPLFLVCFFVLSLVAVVGIKACVIALRKKYEKTPAPKKPRATVNKIKPIKSIEINPEEVDRISFRKT